MGPTRKVTIRHINAAVIEAIKYHLDNYWEEAEEDSDKDYWKRFLGKEDEGTIDIFLYLSLKLVGK